MKPSNVILISAANAASNQASEAIDSRHIVGGSIQGVFSSNTIGGTMALQGSNDPMAGLALDSQNSPIPVNWNTIGTASTVASGATTMATFPQQLNYRWLRAIWTASSGAGTVTINGFFQGF